MLRDERQTALNDVVVACKEAADGYEDAAGLVEDEALAALLRDYGRRRRKTAAALEEQVRRLGDLPRAPDADWETVERVVTRLKTAFSGDERATLLQERADAEAEIGRRATAALAEDLPEEAKALLRQLADEVAEAMRRLATVRSAQ